MGCTRKKCQLDEKDCHDGMMEGCRVLQGVLIITFCAIALLFLRFQTDRPLELLGMVVSVICIAYVVYANPTETFGILFLILVLSYFLISISNDMGTGIQIFMSTFILAVLMYMLIVSCSKTSAAYLLVIVMVIDVIFLYNLLAEEYEW